MKLLARSGNTDRSANCCGEDLLVEGLAVSTFKYCICAMNTVFLKNEI
jgi:hypothetical protein